MKLIGIYKNNTHIRQVLIVSINQNSCYIMVELHLAKARLKPDLKAKWKVVLIVEIKKLNKGTLRKNVLKINRRLEVKSLYIV